MIILITWADLGVRRINVHFAKRVSGRKMYGGQNQVIPLKLISVGVLPLIFAYAFMAFPKHHHPAAGRLGIKHRRVVGAEHVFHVRRIPGRHGAADLRVHVLLYVHLL